MKSESHSTSAPAMPVVEEGVGGFELGDKIVKMAASAAGRQKALELVRKEAERGFVALVDHQLGESGGDFCGEDIFGQ